MQSGTKFDAKSIYFKSSMNPIHINSDPIKIQSKCDPNSIESTTNPIQNQSKYREVQSNFYSNPIQINVIRIQIQYKSRHFYCMPYCFNILCSSNALQN